MGGKLQATATPELVERLRGLLVEEDRMHPVGCATWIEEACVTVEEAADALEAQQARIAELETESAVLTKALTGLTCGGSEFFIRKGDRYVADIDACVSWVRRVKEDAHRRTVKAITEQKASQALADGYEEALRAERDWHDLHWDLSLDGAREETACGTKAAEQALMRRATQHRERMEAIDQALSSSQGRHEGGEDGLPESPGVNAVPLPASPDGPLSDGWLDISTAPKDGTAIQARIPGHGEDNVIEWISDALDDGQGSCGAWTFSHEDQEPPPCWSDGWCWAVNEDGVRSAWPTAWKPLPSPDNTNPKAGAPEHG